jgi:hypothetical protein
LYLSSETTKTLHFSVRKQYSKNWKTELIWFWKCGFDRKMRGTEQVKYHYDNIYKNIIESSAKRKEAKKVVHMRKSTGFDSLEGMYLGDRRVKDM